jgi:hypothetical protein
MLERSQLYDSASREGRQTLQSNTICGGTSLDYISIMCEGTTVYISQEVGDTVASNAFKPLLEAEFRHDDYRQLSTGTHEIPEIS